MPYDQMRELEALLAGGQRETDPRFEGVGGRFTGDEGVREYLSGIMHGNSGPQVNMPLNVQANAMMSERNQPRSMDPRDLALDGGGLGKLLGELYRKTQGRGNAEASIGDMPMGQPGPMPPQGQNLMLPQGQNLMPPQPPQEVMKQGLQSTSEILGAFGHQPPNPQRNLYEQERPPMAQEGAKFEHRGTTYVYHNGGWDVEN